jgi:hypothetical protein
LHLNPLNDLDSFFIYPIYSDAGRVDFIYELTNAFTGEDRGKIIIPYTAR